MKVYLAECSTGGLCNGVYTTLDKAKEAIEEHYRDMRGIPDSADINMKWIGSPLEGWVWVDEAYNGSVLEARMGRRNKTKPATMENISIQELLLDCPLPYV